MERVRWNSFDADKWPLYYDGFHYDTWSSITTFHSVSQYSDIINNTKNTTIGYLAYCLEARTSWLAKNWNCDVTTRERVLNVIYAYIVPFVQIIKFPAPQDLQQDYLYRIIRQSMQVTLSKIEEILGKELF